MAGQDDLGRLPYDRLVIIYHQYAEPQEGDILLRVKEELIYYHQRQVLIRSGDEKNPTEVFGAPLQGEILMTRLDKSPVSRAVPITDPKQRRELTDLLKSQGHREIHFDEGIPLKK